MLNNSIWELGTFLHQHLLNSIQLPIQMLGYFGIMIPSFMWKFWPSFMWIFPGVCSLGRSRQLLDWTGLQNPFLQLDPHYLLLRLHLHLRTHPNSRRTRRAQDPPDRDHLHHQLLRGCHHPHPGRILLEKNEGEVFCEFALISVFFLTPHTPFAQEDWFLWHNV